MSMAILVFLGLVGGVAIAFLLVRLKDRRSTRPVPDAFGPNIASTDVINMAHIKVAGVGGLGLVAVAVVIALTFPRIGQSLALGFVLGVLFAAILILRRRRVGPMPSSGGQMGANTMLSIDEPRRLPDDKHDSDSSNRTAQGVAAIPAASSVRG